MVFQDRQTLFYRLQLILLALWIGGMCTVGYLVAPVLFSQLPDRLLAGTIAGTLFHRMGIIGMACGLILLALQWWQHRTNCFRQWQWWLLVTILLFTMVGLLYLQPAIEGLRDAGEVARASTQFKILHSISSILFLLSSIGGLLLVWFGLSIRQSKS